MVWNQVLVALEAIAFSEPPDGWEQASVVALDNATKWATRLNNDDMAPPVSVFSLPDGGIMFEWTNQDGSIRRADFAPGGLCQWFTTFADKPATWIDMEAK